MDVNFGSYLAVCPWCELPRTLLTCADKLIWEDHARTATCHELSFGSARNVHCEGSGAEYIGRTHPQKTADANAAG